MNARTETELIDNALYDVLLEFAADAIKHLRKHVDQSQIPTIRGYELSKEKGRTRILPTEEPNWWQVSKYMNPVLELRSYNRALVACQRSRILLSRNGQRANALNNGCPFHVSHVPGEFLTECIARENGLKFRRDTFSDVFQSLLNFVSPTRQNKACLIVPLDAVHIERKRIELGSDARIRRLSPTQVVDLVNHCPALSDFYGHGLSPWFSTILELDFSFEWHWSDMTNPDEGNTFKNLQNMQSNDAVRYHRLSEEILLLRALLNKRICAPNNVIDYRGWNSDIFTGGSIHHLPWVRHLSGFPIKVERAEMRRYIKLRSSFLHIQDETAKRRIFAAIRRLSSALVGAYAADRLLDAVAGLEGLFVASNTEVSHKFAERVALFLAQGTDERTKLCKKMKNAYKLRSKVAHGGVIADDLYMLLGSRQPSKKQINEFNSVNKLSGLCMQYLYKAISLCIAKGTVDFDWENSVMSGGPVK